MYPQCNILTTPPRSWWQRLLSLHVYTMLIWEYINILNYTTTLLIILTLFVIWYTNVYLKFSIWNNLYETELCRQYVNPGSPVFTWINIIICVYWKRICSHYSNVWPPQYGWCWWAMGQPEKKHRTLDIVANGKEAKSDDQHKRKKRKHIFLYLRIHQPP